MTHRVKTIIAFLLLLTSAAGAQGVRYQRLLIKNALDH